MSELPFRSLDEIIEAAERVRSGRALVEHYIYPAAKTLLSAQPKVGKSTTAFGIVKAIRTGQPFAGLATSPAAVIYLTEESSDKALSAKASDVDLRSDPGLRFLQRPGIYEKPWRDVVAALRSYAARFKADGGHEDVLIVVDTLSAWAGFRENQEQDSGATREAVELLDALTGDGHAVLIVTHAGWSASRTRGSSAIAGAVDVLLHLEGEPGVWTPRALRYLGGRLDDGDTPARLALILNDDGTFTGRAGTGAVLAVRVESALDVVRRRGEPVTAADVAAELSVSARTARRYLSALVASGELERDERFTRNGREDTYRVTESSPSAVGLAEGLADAKTPKRPAISATGQANGQRVGMPNDDRRLPVSEGEGAVGQKTAYGGLRSENEPTVSGQGRGGTIIIVPFEEWYGDTLDTDPELKAELAALGPVQTPAAEPLETRIAAGLAADDYAEMLQEMTPSDRKCELWTLGVQTIEEARAAYTAAQARAEKARRGGRPDDGRKNATHR